MVYENAEDSERIWRRTQENGSSRRLVNGDGMNDELCRVESGEGELGVSGMERERKTFGVGR